MICSSVVTSTPVKGSSSRMTRPSWARARARKTRFFCPPELADLAVAEVEHPDAGECVVDGVAIGLRGPAEAHVAVAAHRHHVLDEDRKVQSTSSAWGT